MIKTCSSTTQDTGFSISTQKSKGTGFNFSSVVRCIVLIFTKLGEGYGNETYY